MPGLHPSAGKRSPAEADAIEAVAALVGPPSLAQIEAQRARLRELRVKLERARMLRRWASFCRGRLRRPALTRTQQRAADSSVLDDGPRAVLVSAWNSATERDRRDLIAAVTGVCANGR